MTQPEVNKVNEPAVGAYQQDFGLRAGRRVFLVAFLVCFGASAIWSAATPLLAAPDEPAQIAKAAAVEHGIWTGCFSYDASLGHCVPDPSNPNASEKLPAFFALVLAPDGADPSCFIHKPHVPASCARSLNRSASAFDVRRAYNRYAYTYVARYPPLYYLVVGLPARLGGSSIDLYLMRLISAVLSSIFLALAFTTATLWSRNRILPLGILLAVTPMVLFLAGVVNPSGLEISASIAAWTAGTVLVTEQLPNPPSGLLAVLVVASATLALSRSLSPFWVGCLLLVLLALARRTELLQALHDRRVHYAIAAIGAALVGALAWIVPEHALLQYVGNHVGVPSGVSTWTILETAFRRNSYYLPDMVGVFGWFDSYSPLATFIIWGGLLAALVTGAIALGGRRALSVLSLMGAAVVLVPTFIVASHAHQYGYNWSGRDALPLAVGLPIVASALLRRREVPETPNVGRSLAITVVALLSASQFLAFYETLRRYAVGTHGALLGFLLHPSWRPAIGVFPALALEALATSALGYLAFVLHQVPLAAQSRSEP